MTTIAIPRIVIERAVSAVLRAGPGFHGEALFRETEAFRATLQRHGCPSRVAEAYAVSFGRAVNAQVEAAPGGMLQ